MTLLPVKLSRSGVPANPSACNVVRRYQILKPSRANFLGTTIFLTTRASPTRTVLSCRLSTLYDSAITSASSVYRKYTAMDAGARKAFEHELGVSRPLEAWQYLEKPVSDFTSKFEPEDRMVSSRRRS